MATDTVHTSSNAGNDRDPFNNSSYGTLVDSPYKLVQLPVLDVCDFNDRIIRGYEEGTAEKELPADLSVARSLVPAGTTAVVYQLPANPAFVGFRIGYQSLVLDTGAPTGFTTTNALDVVFDF